MLVKEATPKMISLVVHGGAQNKGSQDDFIFSTKTRQMRKSVHPELSGFYVCERSFRFDVTELGKEDTAWFPLPAQLSNKKVDFPFLTDLLPKEKLGIPFLQNARTLCTLDLEPKYPKWSPEYRWTGDLLGSNLSTWPFMVCRKTFWIPILEIYVPVFVLSIANCIWCESFTTVCTYSLCLENSLVWMHAGKLKPHGRCHI